MKPFYLILAFFPIFSCNQKENPLSIQIKNLDNYPSASSIEYYDGKLYLMGDDATNLLVLDTSLTIVDSIPLLSYAEKRIPKKISNQTLKLLH